MEAVSVGLSKADASEHITRDKVDIMSSEFPKSIQKQIFFFKFCFLAGIMFFFLVLLRYLAIGQLMRSSIKKNVKNSQLKSFLLF